MRKPTPKFSAIRNSIIPRSVEIVGWANIYNAKLGEDVFISPFVEIGGAVIGDRTRIGSHSYICPNVEIGTDCFIAHGVMFTNDSFAEPKTYNRIGELRAQWTPRLTVVGNSVRIGSGAVILPVHIGNHAIIGAGAVVTRDVADHEVVMGTPAKPRV
jgi:acetyltransferase-like isoleucine patch superfamily enzyme